MNREYLGDCESCHGPIFRKTRWWLLREHLAYDLWMALPGWIAFSRFGFAILPWAGGVAFSCTCPEKVLA